MTVNYRKDIDGLRAIAVLAVLIYHLNIPLGETTFLRGGFLGVDIFFVISGFLICRIILHEAQAGTVSLWRFYERRCRRLLPALVLVILASLLAGYLILPATAFQHLAETGIASLVFVSNIYWLNEAQVYGATSGLVAPLLHTWSLAIEEQFYIIFPIALLAFLKAHQARLLRILLLGTALGFGLSIGLTLIDFPFSFYMVFSRIWELLFGATLAYAALYLPDFAKHNDHTLARIAPSIGLALIVISLTAMQLRSGHPGLATVPVVLGTGLIIHFGRPSDPVTRLLSSRGLVAIGLISYALYLWHYPIFAYGRLTALMTPDWGDYLIWITLSFAAAILTYRYVERPFGNHGQIGRKTTLSGIGAGVGATICICGALIIGQGFPDRQTGITALYGPANPDNLALRHETWEPLYDRLARYNEDRPTPREMTRRPTKDEATRLWFSTDTDSPKILVVGDSHAKDMFNILHAIENKTETLEVARFGMSRYIEDAVLRDLLTAPNFKAADVVMISMRYRAEAMHRLPVLLAALQSAGKTVALTSRMPEFQVNDPFNLFDEHLRRTDTLDVAKLEAEAWSKLIVTTQHPTNVALQAMAAEHGLPVLNKHLLLCDTTAERCAMATKDGRKIHYDHSHVTLHGAAFLADRITDTGWLAPVLPDLN